jgi:hypothetical protein
MKPNGSAGIHTELAIGSPFRHALWIGISSLGTRTLLILLGGIAIYIAAAAGPHSGLPRFQEVLEVRLDRQLLAPAHARHERGEQPQDTTRLHLPRPAHAGSLGQRLEGQAPLGQKRSTLPASGYRARP